MIRIVIERRTSERYMETVNFCVKRTPTGQTKESSYGDKTPVYEEVNEPREVTKYRDVTRTLLEQEIDDEESFDLGSVIIAINNLGGGK